MKLSPLPKINKTLPKNITTQEITINKSKLLSNNNNSLVPDDYVESCAQTSTYTCCHLEVSIAPNSLFVTQAPL